MGRKILDLDFKCSKCWTPVYLENVEKTKKQNEIPNETGSANGASIYGS